MQYAKNWERFHIKQSGTCWLRERSGRMIEQDYAIGIITTGKTQVYWGEQIFIGQVAGRSEAHGETYRCALQDCVGQLEERGLTLLAAGNCPRYSESPMSGGAGYGYLEGVKGAVHILAFVADVGAGGLEDRGEALAGRAAGSQDGDQQGLGAAPSEEEPLA
ncbi:hypothetical protein [Halorhodospira halochloris]|uniref:hypothetical protein n=1 Tax=Halorhodospira halochloris TaxID=1052 RepID=UPI001EE81E86|nr:hypothetical protein [Halorhodospira halochloris]MCG5549436.1 hypothetical protein [Halorhodospira halochloris]